MREVLITSGATEALSDAINALIEPGDEVVLIEPLYDCYLPLVRRAGGVPRLVRVVPPDWSLDPEALAAAFSPRTKALLLNNPHNPAAKVYSPAELKLPPLPPLAAKYGGIARRLALPRHPAHVHSMFVDTPGSYILDGTAERPY